MKEKIKYIYVIYRTRYKTDVIKKIGKNLWWTANLSEKIFCLQAGALNLVNIWMIFENLLLLLFQLFLCFSCFSSWNVLKLFLMFIFFPLINIFFSVSQICLGLSLFSICYYFSSVRLKFEPVILIKVVLMKQNKHSTINDVTLRILTSPSKLKFSDFYQFTLCSWIELALNLLNVLSKTFTVIFLQNTSVRLV